MVVPTPELLSVAGFYLPHLFICLLHAISCMCETNLLF